MTFLFIMNEARQEDKETRRQGEWPLFLSPYLLVSIIFGAIVIFAVARYQQWPAPIVSRDLNQHRANTVAALPNDALFLEQRFVAQKNGFSQLEVIFSRDSAVPIIDDQGQLTLALLDETGTTIASETLATQDITHNQVHVVKFAPIRNSAETRYTLKITGQNNRAISLWGYNLDTLSDSVLITSQPAQATRAQDLRLITHYTLTPSVAIRTLLNQFARYGSLIVLTSAFLFMPGVVIWQIAIAIRRQSFHFGDAYTHLAIQLALGTATWPLIWLWVTVLGGRFGRISLALLLILGYAVALILRTVNSKRLTVNSEHTHSLTIHHSPFTIHHFLHLILLPSSFILILATRLLAIRDLAFPAWVDSSRHALMTAVMADSGQFLRNYQPYLDASQSLYHYGYHTLSASLLLLNGGTLPDILLITGQLINALIPLSIYAAAHMITQRRSVAYVAAFLVALPFFFPGYYVSWGRLTQLTAMLLMPLLVALTWRVSNGEKPSANSQFTIHNSQLIIFFLSLFASATFLIHFRVFLIYLPFALLIYIIYLRKTPWQLPLAGALTALLVAPRAWELLRIGRNTTIANNTPGYNSFPSGYITTGWERQLLIVTIAALVFAFIHLLNHQRWLTWVIASGLLAFVAANEWLGDMSLLFNLPFLRTGVLALLLAITLSGMWQKRYLWTLPPTLWLAFETFAESWQQSLAAAMLVVLFVALVPHIPQRGWSTKIILLSLWVGLLFLSLLGSAIGLPESWVITLNSMYITLFLPFALAIAIAFGVLWHLLGEQHAIVQAIVGMVIGGAFCLLAIFGTHAQIKILNPETVLAETPDLPALAWLDANTPGSAKVAVSSWLWLGGTWAAQDGGAWIVPLTKRQATTPPADYLYNRELFREVGAFNVSAEKITDWSTDEAINLLRDNAVTHVYVGAHGGFIKPDQLDRHPDSKLIYEEGGVFIFNIEQ